MSHPLDHYIRISEVAQNLGPDVHSTVTIGSIDRMLDKGLVTDKVAAGYDISSTIPVAEDGFPSNQEESGNIFIIGKISQWQTFYENNDFDQTNEFYMPSPNSLSPLSTSELRNFLTWTPDGIPFTADINIGAVVAA
jgi:hypothetical protein